MSVLGLRAASAAPLREVQTTRGHLDFYYFVLIVVLILILIIVHIAIMDVFVVPDYVDVCLLGFFI